jgi:hypothetical protein
MARSFARAGVTEGSSNPAITKATTVREDAAAENHNKASYLIGEATNTLIDYAFPCLQTSTFMKKVSAGLCG